MGSLFVKNKRGAHDGDVEGVIQYVSDNATRCTQYLRQRENIRFTSCTILPQKQLTNQLATTQSVDHRKKLATSPLSKHVF